MSNPMYRRIADDLREQIESGQLEPGQQLRTELDCARSTTLRETPSATPSSGSPPSVW